MLGRLRYLVVAIVLLFIPVAFSATTLHGYVLKSTPVQERWIANAVVRCSSQSNDYVATSGADGYFSMQGLEPGKYTCSASAAGYYSAIREVIIECQQQTCQCQTCDASYKRADFFLKPREEMSRIYGHVFRNGKGVEAEVRCGDRTASSDSSGYYEMALPAGTYYCTADGRNGKSIMLYPGENRVMNFFITSTLPPSPPATARLYGYTYANGRKVSMGIECGNLATRSNSMGYYSIYLPEGIYTCTARHLSYHTTFTVTVSGETRRDISINYPVPRKYKLYGYVYGDGTRLDNARVECDGNIVYTSNGYYEIVLDEGSYTCRFSKPGFRSRVSHVSLSSDRRLDISLARVERRFRLYGTAYPGLTLSCNGPESRTVSIYGSYSVSMKEGRYSCRAHAPGYRQESFTISLFSDTRRDIRLSRECRHSFSISGGGEKQERSATFLLRVRDYSTCTASYDISYSSDCDNVDISPRRFTLSGSVMDVRIDAQSSRDCRVDVRVSSEGGTRTATFRLRPDTTAPSISVNRDGCGTGFSVAARDDSGWARIRIYRSGRLVKECVNYCTVNEDLGYGRHSYRIVAEDRSMNRAEKSVEVESCRLSALDGRIMSDAGPVGNAVVKCDGKAVETGADGRFSFRLRPGYYVCSAVAEGYARKNFAVRLDNDRSVTVYLQKLGTERTGTGNVTRIVEAYSFRERVAAIGERIETARDMPWLYYARAVLWWIALILAIALLIFIVIVMISSRD